jgi:hypothetical protein
LLSTAVEAGHLPHELQRGRSNLVFGHGRREIEEDSDISAHIRCLEHGRGWSAPHSAPIVKGIALNLA